MEDDVCDKAFKRLPKMRLNLIGGYTKVTDLLLTLLNRIIRSIKQTSWCLLYVI